MLENYFLSLASADPPAWPSGQQHGSPGPAPQSIRWLFSPLLRGSRPTALNSRDFRLRDLSVSQDFLTLVECFPLVSHLLPERVVTQEQEIPLLSAAELSLWRFVSDLVSRTFPSRAKQAGVRPTVYPSQCGGGYILGPCLSEQNISCIGVMRTTSP